MSLVRAENISYYYGPDLIFENVTIELPPDARVALVGPNGAGKTTLAHVLMGDLTPTDGILHQAGRAQIGYLSQRPELLGDHTLWQEALSAFEPLMEMETRLAELSHQMADPDHYDDAVREYGALEEQFEQGNGYNYESLTRRVLTGLGFSDDDLKMPLTMLSGGQRTRAVLARLLLEAPLVLVLDEPTNHLDIHAIEWLEGYLKEFSGAVLAISHDRSFIDNFATTVWELEFHTVETYRGNYTHYLRQRDERRERRLKEFEAQQEFIAKEQAFIRKHMGSRLTAQAKGRQKKLDTMAKRGRILANAPRDRKQMGLIIGAETRTGDKVIVTRDLVVGYDEPLFNMPNVTIYRGDTVAVIGRNGAGKSTLLKTLIGELEPLSGTVDMGAQVQIGYFAQAHEGLDGHMSIIDTIMTRHNKTLSEARQILGRYLFSDDDVFRPVDSLSGGERGRVALASLALSGANVLLLDEPTNHLDIDSQEILQEALHHFDGTCLMVSHDRALIESQATHIWDVTGTAKTSQVRIFDGGYREYMAALQAERQAEATPVVGNDASNGNGHATTSGNGGGASHGLSPYQYTRRVEAMEGDIERLEAEIAEVEAQIQRFSTAGDARQVAELGADHARLQGELEAAIESWSTLVG